MYKLVLQAILFHLFLDFDVSITIMHAYTVLLKYNTNVFTHSKYPYLRWNVFFSHLSLKRGNY